MLQTDIEDDAYLGATHQQESTQRIAKHTLAIPAGTLSAALADVTALIERSGTIPILGCLRLAGSDGHVAITGTDMEIVIDIRLAADVTDFGPIVLSGVPIYEAIRKLPRDTRVEMTATDAALRIKAGRFSISMPTHPTEDYPSLGTAVFPCQFSLPAVALRRLIDKTRWAVSSDTTRYYLNGIYLHVHDAHLRAVGCDGSLLAMADCPVPVGAAEMPGVIVPTKAVTALRKALDGLDGEVTVHVSDRRLKVVAEGTTIASKLVDGTFPEYEPVIPRGNDKRLRLVAKPFLSALSVVTGFAEQRLYRGVKLALSNAQLVLSSQSPEIGSADAEIGVGDMEYAGPSMEIGFQARYLNALIGAISGDAEIALRNPDSSVLVTDTADDAVRFVVMPYKF